MIRLALIAALAVPAWMAAQGNPADPQAKPAAGQKKKAPSKTNGPVSRNPAAGTAEAMMPNLSRSPTGYVEDAAVGTMIRVRFDTGFDMSAPDRGEFFYGKCGCYRTAGADPNAPGPDSPTQAPVIVTKLRFEEAHLNLEYGFHHRFSVVVDANARFLQPQLGISPVTSKIIPNPFGAQAGPGDLQAGFKFAAIGGERGFLTFQFRTYFPTGDALVGLGTDHYSIEPGVLFTRKLGDRVGLSGQFSVWHPLDGSSSLGVPNAKPSESFAGNVLTYGAGLSYRFQAGEQVRIAPVVELVGWNLRSGFVTLSSGPAPASGNSIVNGKLGARFYVGGHSSIYAGFGRQLSHVGWYRDFMRIEYARVF